MPPRFSVVIPTRERADTLRYALRTCLDQTFDDYEVIVSDNFSAPATRGVVDAVGSPKVRYVRTAEPVAMSNNWEFGVSHARGEYVLLIGDDDALLPHALTELDRLARTHGAKAIQWTAAYYAWPNIALAGQGNYLRIPWGCELCERDGAAVIRDVVAFRAGYADLPMLYNAAVHRDVLADLRQRVGRVFPHPIPDVYSGFAIAYVAGRYLSTTVPMTISGQAGASNGVATFFHRGRSDLDREFHALNAKDGLLTDPTVPDLPVLPHVPVADAFAYAKRVLFPNLDAELDRRALVVACVVGARVAETDWPAALAAVRDSLADVPPLRAWFDAELAATPYRDPDPVRLRPDRLGVDREYIHIDASAFGVTDVAGAAELCDRLLGHRQEGLNYQRVAPGAARAVRAELEEKESLIHRLHAACADLQIQLREQNEAHGERERTLAAQLQDQLRTLDRREARIAELEARRSAGWLKGTMRRLANRVLRRPA